MQDKNHISQPECASNLAIRLTEMHTEQAAATSFGGSQVGNVAAANAPVATKLPTHDEIRAIARSARTSASDSASPSEYVIAGYRAALSAQAAPLLPEEIPASNTLWRFLTKGMTHSDIAGLPEHDREVLTERAQKNWAAIRAEAEATAPVLQPLADVGAATPAHLTFSQWWTDVGHVKVAEMANSNGWRGAAEAGYAAGVLQVAPTATEQDVMDAKRYQWLFGARTKDQVTSVSSTVFNPLPQDFVLSELQCFYTHKAMADAMIDDAMAAQKSRESQS